MCKSRIRQGFGAVSEPDVLIPDELHNWLLFRSLRRGELLIMNRPIGRPSVLTAKRLLLPQAFPQDAVPFIRLCKPKSLQHLSPLASTGNPVGESAYSSGAIPPSASDSNRVQCLRNAIFTRPMGPLRCLAIMISARPCSSGSSCL